MEETVARKLSEAVREAYSAAAERPGERHAFPVGRQFAESLGYPADLLDSLPPAAVDAFTGVSNVSLFAGIPEGSTVLDLGCGAGLDCLIAARRTGPRGRVIGLDFCDAMLSRAGDAAKEAGAENVTVQKSEADHMPLETESVDVALVNGIFNLNPKREEIFSELARVLRPGGEVYAAELILKESNTAPIERTSSNWFS